MQTFVPHRHGDIGGTENEVARKMDCVGSTKSVEDCNLTGQPRRELRRLLGTRAGSTMQRRTRSTIVRPIPIRSRRAPVSRARSSRNRRWPRSATLLADDVSYAPRRSIARGEL